MSVRYYVVRNYSAVSNYKKIAKYVDDTVNQYTPRQVQVLWNHPAGFKTVFFWAPLFKWGLVLAGISDLITRQGDQVSLYQAGSLMVSGAIWSRYSVVIIPVNYMLLSVNLFVCLIQGLMFYRGFKYQYYVLPYLNENQKHKGKHEDSKKDGS